jgi:hypothetical protein
MVSLNHVHNILTVLPHFLRQGYYFNNYLREQLWLGNEVVAMQFSGSTTVVRNQTGFLLTRLQFLSKEKHVLCKDISVINFHMTVILRVYQLHGLKPHSLTTVVPFDT